METAHAQTYEQSPTIGAFAAAFAKAQATFTKALKNKVNPHFRSKYADLDSVQDACMPQLNAAGIAVIQQVGSANGMVTVRTLLAHSSGEWVAGTTAVPASRQDAQGYGGAITYARRYGLSGMAGVATEEDDDGNAAVGRPQQGQQSTQPQRAPQQQAKPPPPAPKPEAPKAAEPSPLRARGSRLWAQAKSEAGMDADGFRGWAQTCLGHSRPSAEWTAGDLAILEKDLAKGIAEMNGHKAAVAGGAQ